MSNEGDIQKVGNIEPNGKWEKKTNIIQKNIINWQKMDKLIDEGYVIKPHPITAHLWIAKMKLKYGKDKILNKKAGGFELLLNCKEMAMCPNSEMGLIALLLG